MLFKQFAFFELLVAIRSVSKWSFEVIGVIDLMYFSHRSIIFGVLSIECVSFVELANISRGIERI
jgi:hypothetical protein